MNNSKKQISIQGIKKKLIDNVVSFML